MLNFQVAAPKDLKEAARIEKTRQYEEQRKARIFNPRQRLIGVSPFRKYLYCNSFLRTQCLFIFIQQPLTAHTGRFIHTCQWISYNLQH